MRVSELMTKDVLTVREGEELGLTRDLQRFWRHRHLPVINAEGVLVGLLSRIDMLEQASRPESPRTISVAEAMRRDPLTIGPASTVREALEKMQTNGIHILPVVDDDGLLLGIFTDSDALAGILGKDLPASPTPPLQRLGEIMVSEVMTPDPKTIDTDSPVEEAAGALLEGGFRHLPVLDSSLRLTGMISERDLRASLGTSLRDWGSMDSARLEEVIANVMVPEPVFVREYNRLVDILDVFTDEKIGAVPVLDQNDVLVGILSYVDILKWFERQARASGLETERMTQVLESLH